MPTYRCPVCHTKLTKEKYERALHFHEAQKEHIVELQGQVRRLGDKVKTAAATGREQERTKVRRQLEGKDKQIDKLKATILSIKRGTTLQTEGLEFEKTLCQRLRREFRGDTIQHYGTAGDILHIVRVGGVTAGTIVYECKRTPRLASAHVEQAYVAKRKREAEFAVLVTTAEKRGFNGFALMNGVCVVSPLVVVGFVTLLREHLLELHRARVTKEQRAKVAQALLEFIASSSGFKAPIEGVIRRAKALQVLVKEEVRAHIRVWNKRWQTYQEIEFDAIQIQNNVQRVLRREAPTLTQAKLVALPLPKK